MDKLRPFLQLYSKLGSIAEGGSAGDALFLAGRNASDAMASGRWMPAGMRAADDMREAMLEEKQAPNLLQQDSAGRRSSADEFLDRLTRGK